MAGVGEARLEGLLGQERELREAAGGRREAPLSKEVDQRAEPDTEAGTLALIEIAQNAVNRVMSILGMVALLVASLVLTYSVFSRYLFRAATDWQDEIAVFCIVGAVFLARPHRTRIVLVDLMTLAFCAFFAWKSWTLFHEAWVDKMTTSSTFAPPL